MKNNIIKKYQEKNHINKFIQEIEQCFSQSRYDKKYKILYLCDSPHLSFKFSQFDNLNDIKKALIYYCSCIAVDVDYGTKDLCDYIINGLNKLFHSNIEHVKDLYILRNTFAPFFHLTPDKKWMETKQNDFLINANVLNLKKDKDYYATIGMNELISNFMLFIDDLSPLNENYLILKSLYSKIRDINTVPEFIYSKDLKKIVNIITGINPQYFEDKYKFFDNVFMETNIGRVCLKYYNDIEQKLPDIKEDLKDCNLREDILNILTDCIDFKINIEKEDDKLER